MYNPLRSFSHHWLPIKTYDVDVILDEFKCGSRWSWLGSNPCRSSVYNFITDLDNLGTHHSVWLKIHLFAQSIVMKISIIRLKIIFLIENDHLFYRFLIRTPSKQTEDAVQPCNFVSFWVLSHAMAYYSDITEVWYIFTHSHWFGTSISPSDYRIWRTRISHTLQRWLFGKTKMKNMKWCANVILLLSIEHARSLCL